mgnify:CR=1 FL=1
METVEKVRCIPYHVVSRFLDIARDVNARTLAGHDEEHAVVVYISKLSLGKKAIAVLACAQFVDDNHTVKTVKIAIRHVMLVKPFYQFPLVLYSFGNLHFHNRLFLLFADTGVQEQQENRQNKHLIFHNGTGYMFGS